MFVFFLTALSSILGHFSIDHEQFGSIGKAPESDRSTCESGYYSCAATGLVLSKEGALSLGMSLVKNRAGIGTSSATTLQLLEHPQNSHQNVQSVMVLSSSPKCTNLPPPPNVDPQMGIFLTCEIFFYMR